MESDSKLGRKGERPTVAQILDLNQGDPQWVNVEATPESVPRKQARGPGHRSLQPKTQLGSEDSVTAQGAIVRTNNTTNIQSAGFFNATSNFEQM